MVAASLSQSSHRLFAWAAVAVVLLVYGIAVSYFPVVYIWATYEDLFGEWAQWYLFVFAGVFSVMAARRASDVRWTFWLLALACLYTVMEEISWGQRIFGFESPAYFRANNLQGETNLHNFLTGPYSTDIKAFLKYAISFALVGYGVVYPMMWRMQLWPAVFARRLGLAVPPLYLAPGFVAAAVLEIEPFSFNEAEVAEVLVGLSVMLVALHYVVVHPLDVAEGVSGELGGQSKRLAVRMLLAVTAVGVLATTTTGLLYASPERAQRIDNRIENGYKKFGGRYVRIERWDAAIDMYQRHLALAPRSTSRLRRLARTYRDAGNEVMFKQYAEEALRQSLARYSANPESPAANRNMVRAHRLLGDFSAAEYHEDKALRLSLKLVAEQPNDAGAAYSLARTYDLLGSDAAAFHQFERAYQLKPSSRTYRDAYRKRAIQQ